jgi:hypothetical protein
MSSKESVYHHRANQVTAAMKVMVSRTFKIEMILNCYNFAFSIQDFLNMAPQYKCSAQLWK